MNEAEMQEILDKVDKAWDMLDRLCTPRTDPRHQDWLMSIPARPEHDPDLIISEALSQVPKLLDEIERLMEDVDSLSSAFEEADFQRSEWEQAAAEYQTEIEQLERERRDNQSFAEMMFEDLVSY